MGKCVHSLQYKVVLRYAISFWKPQLKVQRAFSALHLLLKCTLTVGTVRPHGLSFCVHASTMKEQNATEFLNRHGILQRLFMWCKDYECDKWNPNIVSILPLKCNTSFWPSVRTLWCPRIDVDKFKSNLYSFNQSNEKYLSLYPIVKNSA